MKNLIRLTGFLFAMMAIFFISNFFEINISYAAKVNINTASATELDTIPEVGPSTATKIITYRETIGLFLVIEDIMKVSGIKEATFAKLKDYICVSDDTSGDTGGGTGTTTVTSTNPTATTTTATATSPQVVNTIVYSTHYIQEDLSDYKEPTNIFEISAGRNRLAHVDSPVKFVAKYKVSKDVAGKSCDYVWTFGDGSSVTGEEAEHVYKYAGDYNVVLNGTCGDLSSVSRAIVKVLTPSLSVSQKSDGSVEILNLGKYEINLYKWRLQASDKSFTFPLDTIISANKSVTFPVEYLKISTINNDIILINSSAERMAQTRSNLAVSSPDEVIPLANFEKFVVEYRKNNPSPVNNINKPVYVPMTAAVISAFVSTTSVSDQAEDTSSSTAAEVPVRGFWSKLFHPIRTIKEAFYQ